MSDVKPNNEFIDFRKKIFDTFDVDNNNVMSALQIVDINVTEICTRKCVFCPRVDRKLYPNRNLHMSMDTVDRLVNDLSEFEYKNQIVFAGFSEPLAHKQLSTIISKFRKGLPYNQNISITTNGDLLSDKKLNEIFESGLNLIKMSLYDGPEQEEKFLKQFEKCGLKENQFVIKRFWKGFEEEFGMSGISNRVGMMKLNRRKIPKRACHMPFNSTFIDWNGNLLLCTHDWRKTIIHGNINEKTFKEIWLGESIKKIRMHHLKHGRCGLKPCEGCEVHGQVYGKKSFEVFQKQYA
jgi:radical SAM protein with 4Fe4S-binding SPASM domain